MNPTRLGEYRIIASLGRGGMADVFLAARLGPVNFTKLVVIKKLRSDLAQQSDAKRYRALLLDEARLAARMHHPNIVQTFEVTEAGAEPWMTMEYLDGQSLSHVVRAARRAQSALPLEMALRVIGDVLAALSYAHELRDFDGTPLDIVHRDVSPQNVFWTYDGELKLMDFGVAKFAQGSTQTDAGFIKGKVSYMAPEQARGEPVDQRADVFAVGVVMWELLSGRRLYKANSQAASMHKLLFEPVAELTQIVPNIDPAVAAICRRALAHDREQRYPDAAAMRSDIEDVLESTSPRRDQLASFVRTLFASQRQTVADQIRVALSSDKTEVIQVSTDDGDESDGSAPDGADLESATDGTATVASRPRRTSRPIPAVPSPQRPRRRPLVIGLVGAIAAFAITAGVVAMSSHERTPAPAATPPAPPVRDATAKPLPALRLCGSNTIGADLGPALVEAFLRKKGASDVARHAGSADETTITGTLNGTPVEIDLAAHGSSTAFEGLVDGTCDVGMSSRAVKEAEVDKLARAGVGDLRTPATEHVIAVDGIAVIVHPNNPLRGLTRDALHDVFTGKIVDWSQLGGKPGPISVYARDDRSGTYDTFKSLVLGDDKLVASAKRLSASDGLSDAVATEPSAIGFIGLAYVRSAKALPIGDSGATGMLPTSFTVTTEDYMLSRRLYFYTTPKPRTPLVSELVSFAMTPAGQGVVRESGFVDLAIALHDAEPCGTRCPPRYASAITRARRLSLDFRFRTGSNELDSRATRDLDRLVQMMRTRGGGQLLLLGFSDASGDSAVNTKLSLDRARTVANELAMRGLTPAVVDGFGEALPVAANTTSAGRDRNRRVEVWVRD